jgi:glutamine synthetase
MSINIEAMTMLNMARRQILPACIEYSSVLGSAVGAVRSAGIKTPPQKKLLENVCRLIGQLTRNISELEKTLARVQKLADTTKRAGKYRDGVIPAMQALRVTADELETIVDAELWPVPTYAEMLFIR